MHQCDDFQEALQWMSSEHKQLEANLTATCRLLAKLQGEVPQGDPAPCDVLQLSAQAQRAARSLCHQVAASGGSANLRLGPSPVVCATPAESFAQRTDCAYEEQCHLTVELFKLGKSSGIVCTKLGRR
uniref:Basic leucine zipper nuclear factor 1(Blzf1) protein n=1 Tax=Rhipicephalus appendiculatus TaxID=34631 RepID=A0A131YQQ0_RHIAP